MLVGKALRGIGGALVGRLGERRAAGFLRRRGLRIVARNVRCGHGELDIVAMDGETIVFVEVKSSTERSRRPGIERLDAAKRRNLRRVSRRFLSGLRARGIVCAAWRFDAVCVDFRVRGGFPRVVEIRWYPGIEV